MTRTAPHLGRLLVTGLAVGVASLGTMARGQVGEQPVFAPVQGGTEDVNPLGGQGRLVPRDLREAIGFEQVFRVTNSNLFARRSGGLTAVFDRSVYQATDGGAVPVIPPGTVFYIGDPASELSGFRAERPANTPPRAGSVDTRRDLRVNTRRSTEPRGSRPAATAGVPGSSRRATGPNSSTGAGTGAGTAAARAAWRSMRDAASRGLWWHAANGW